jgi:hypothetical protein
MAQTPASKLAHAVDEAAAVLFGIRLGQHNSCARGKNLTIFVGEAGVDSQLLPLSSPQAPISGKSRDGFNTCCEGFEP